MWGWCHHCGFDYLQSSHLRHLQLHDNCHRHWPWCYVHQTPSQEEWLGSKSLLGYKWSHHLSGQSTCRDLHLCIFLHTCQPINPLTSYRTAFPLSNSYKHGNQFFMQLNWWMFNSLLTKQLNQEIDMCISQYKGLNWGVLMTIALNCLEILRVKGLINSSTAIKRSSYI